MKSQQKSIASIHSETKMRKKESNTNWWTVDFNWILRSIYTEKYTAKCAPFDRIDGVSAHASAQARVFTQFL